MSGNVVTLAAVGGSVALLLLLILRLKIPAFLALLIVSVAAGLLLRMPPLDILQAMRAGMGGTLGFVAVVVGLGSMLGALLEYSGGISSIARSVLNVLGQKRAPWGLAAVGFLVAIPVFFDVALIILAPLVYGLAHRSGQSVVWFALPLLAGLAVTHAFVPPTPGPVAVAELLDADLGWIVIFGALAGIPSMLVAGPLYSSFLRRKRALKQPSGNAMVDDVAFGVTTDSEPGVAAGPAILAVMLPLLLVVAATMTKSWNLPDGVSTIFQFIGHPFSALTIACIYAYWSCGISRGVPPADLNRLMTKALEPAGIVVLVTGAGGVFKEVLVRSNAGATIAEIAGHANLSPLMFGFLVALILRVAQGSATVAMVTAAGLAAPMVAAEALSAQQTALVAIAIAAGATACSHVNDSGFWLVSRYFHLSEAETLKTWTVTSSLIGAVGVAAAYVLWQFVPAAPIDPLASLP